MSAKHPYVTAPSYLVQVVSHFRKSFPSVVDATILKKLAIAPKNESYVLNTLRYLGLIDQEGHKTEMSTKVFSLHDDAAFSREFEKLVATSYRDLFELHGNNSWELDIDKLISFFRTSDETTERVGKLQASTFQILSGLSGHGSVQERTSTPKPAVVSPKARKPKIGVKFSPDGKIITEGPIETGMKRNIGLTVRIEINLPANGDKETYDRIFRSIRENLLDA